ncbi:polysaccharide pyruvyl transferase family protein [Arthrobacter sp. OV608]|uniref:polysaccharide pyruvyl transferase family protein n=1 Tax=Arthrobacter sp. OV608 TaxID=1882768 RepID=UPI0008C70006|nr:polysaccharide pyruvyl transferase family protein [Arthrobacter sp. OV608]SEP86366.1 colanic acid/amylovoran biosynthesis protein [Arthrobacter sp. OV608]
MTIDLRGVNTHNKGAELMMYAVAERLGGKFPIAVSPNGSAYDVRARLGMRQTLLMNQAPLASGFVGSLVPAKLRDAFGLTSETDVSGVLDAAGFAYSDSFSPVRSKREALVADRRKKRGVPTVFLPQAFGPFKNEEQRKWSKQLLVSAELVFARDQVSLAHVRQLDPAINVQLSPDFTIGLKAPRSSRFSGDYAALVPNVKMITHTGLGEDAYTDSFITAGQVLRAAGIEPVIVVHEFNDNDIAHRVAQQLDCDVFRDKNPLVLKGVIGNARVAIASRFHAIVGALSQNTPVLAFGWSHKYEQLLGDYGVERWLFSAEQDIKESIENLIADDEGLAILEAKQPELLAENDRMWSAVIDVLGSARP